MNGDCGAPTGEISTAEAFHVLADDDLAPVIPFARPQNPQRSAA